MKTDRGSYDSVDVEGERVVLAVGVLGSAGGLTVKVKKSHSQQPLPRGLESEPPLDDGEHPQVAA